MNSEIQLIAITGSLLMMYLVFYLIRQRRLREEYALLWFAAGLVLLVFSFWRGLLDRVAQWVGIAYPPSVLLLAMIVFGFLLAMHYSVSLSRLAEQNKRLTQELALLRNRVEQREGRAPRKSFAQTGEPSVMDENATELRNG
ncbi:MAG: DUF2304 domain-containing protein [Acidobacteria bacterium]|nr:DUF2304 domain-containing protein [Acidobacteriota bacterium]MBI3427414.1 DUF2304 domain-containing protein [Acidobacteriota bacterium]